MSVQGEDDTGPDASPTEVDPRDGSIDFTQYSAAQLTKLQSSIDRRKFPQTYDELLSVLARRETEDAQSTPLVRVAGKFTCHDGVRGWLEAKRMSFSVYGTGVIEVRPKEIVLFGWQRTWLGVPLQTQITVPVDAVRNVTQEDAWLRFEYQSRYRRRRVELRTASVAEAARLRDALPRVRTADFEAPWSEVREFNRYLNTVSGPPWITPAIVIANLAVFMAMVLAAKRFGTADLQQLLVWGANFGPLTVGGQWWRLLTALFIHFNLLHVLLNMWAFWNVGRLTERLYGRWVFLGIYLSAGILGNIASIAWDPSRMSAGASGAIFGVFGAFLAFLAHRKAQVPRTIFRAYWISTMAFVLFNLFYGFRQSTVDNAAHVVGLLSGFVLGWIMARPLNLKAAAYLPPGRGIAAAVLVVAALLAGLWQVHGLGSQVTIPEQYFRDRNWFVAGEVDNLRLWQEISARASVGSISDAELGERFERDILPFWQQASERLQKETKSLAAAQRPFALLVADFAKAREEWVRALISGAKNRDPEGATVLADLQRNTVRAQARIERLEIRASMDHRPRALASSPFLAEVRGLWSGPKKCAEAPATSSESSAALPATTDGPAIRQAVGCDAQRLFMSTDYRALDQLMGRFSSSLADLPDGGSRLEGLTEGLSDLFEYGTLELREVLRRTSDWRRSMPGSVQPDLVETMLFRIWAWSARGQGAANTVTPQAWTLFIARDEMAAVGLREITDRAAADPLWYSLALNTGIDQSIGIEKLRAIFDRGVARFPRYLPLYRSILRTLMPRWNGSYEKVDQFINEMSEHPSAHLGPETYSRLYWMYGLLEGDDVVIFDDALASWQKMKSGFKDMRARYPKSDLVLNSYARFACQAGDFHEYHLLRPLLTSRLAATAWSKKVSIGICDAKVDAANVSVLKQSSSESSLTEEELLRVQNEARLAFANRDWEMVKVEAQKITNAHANSIEGYALAGAAEQGAGQYEAAAADFHRALLLAPRSAYCWFGLGEAQVRTHDYAGAVEAYTRAIELNPQMWRAWSGRSVVRDALGQRTAALHDAQTACRNDDAFACRLVQEFAPSRAIERRRAISPGSAD
ncbi:MAG TPA: rhomboid family intramembrane serine protease [Steroidobacteraceae bacterium]|jgi:membrane associated rhomboid family serine protease/tetratricopeptide (TPR) repeat protein|nr:rhomboid family intramembrane serine protease [Steroidobacteraceae bacterium]